LGLSGASGPLSGSFCGVKSVGVAGRAVFVRPAHDVRLVLKIAVRRRRGRLPVERGRAPGISLPTFSPWLMLQNKLMMNGICAMPSAMAAHKIHAVQLHHAAGSASIAPGTRAAE
jgi:hypothetical protein